MSISASIGGKNDGYKFHLTAPVSVGAIQAPRGFKSNLNSTPNSVFKGVPYNGDTVSAVVIHDYLYYHKNKDRKTADLKLKKDLLDAGVGFLKRWSVYLNCRVFGNKRWHNAKRVNVSPIKR